MKKFTLTAADLMVILTTLNHSLAIMGDWDSPREMRKAVLYKIDGILQGMEATITADPEESQ